MTEENNDRLNFREEYLKVCEGELDDSSNFFEKIASLAEETCGDSFEWDGEWDERVESYNSTIDELLFDESEVMVKDLWSGLPSNSAKISPQFGGGDRPLYEGSCHNGHDLFRFLLALKCKHFKMGDNAISSIIGMLASFLPEDNIIAKALQEHPTTYKLLQVMNDMASLENDMRCLKVDVCREKGCSPFFADKIDANFCDDCGACRWNDCKRNSCFDEEDNKTCDHPNICDKHVFYLPIEDRLRKIVRSDMKEFTPVPKVQTENNSFWCCTRLL